MKILSLSFAKQNNINSLNAENSKQYKATPSFAGRNDVFVNASRAWIKSAIETAEQNNNNSYTELGQYEFILSNRTNFENMLNFENIPDMSKQRILEWINTVLLMEKNYDKRTAISRAEDLIRRRMEQLKHGSNIVERAWEQIVDLFSGGKTSEADKIVAECQIDLDKEKGQINFIRANRSNFQTFINSVTSDTSEKQPAITDVSVLKASEPGNNSVTEVSNAALQTEAAHAASRATHAYEQRAAKENFSLLVKKTFTPDAPQEERLKYFTEYVFPLMKTSEASAFDGLEMFEKYGMNTEYRDGAFSTLGSLVGAIPTAPSDKLISRFVDVFDKYAEKASKKNRVDLDAYVDFLTDRNFSLTMKHISEDTLIKALQPLKKMIYDKKVASGIQESLQLLYTDARFVYESTSDAVPEIKVTYPVGKFVNSEKVKQALQELVEA